MATMNISLPDEMKAHVEDWVATGEYANASDFVRSLIRERMDRHAHLDKLLQEGLDSGDPEPFDGEAFLAELLAEDDLDAAA